jgi:hypothetical protein
MWAEFARVYQKAFFFSQPSSQKDISRLFFKYFLELEINLSQDFKKILCLSPCDYFPS